MDLFSTLQLPGGIQALVTNGLCFALDDLLAEYGQGILERQPEAVRAGSNSSTASCTPFPTTVTAPVQPDLVMNKAVLGRTGH